MTKKSKLAVMLNTMIFILAFSLTSFAKEVIVPYWTNLMSIHCAFDIDYDGKAMIDIIITADPGNTDQVNSTCKLQRLEGNTWKTLKTWNETGIKGESDIAYDKTYYVADNYSYRLEVTAKAYYNGSLKETVTEYFDYGWYGTYRIAQ